MFLATLLVSSALAQDPADLPLPTMEVPVVDVIAPRALRRAEAIEIAGRATFWSGTAVLATGTTMALVGVSRASQGELLGATSATHGVIAGGLGAIGVVVGGVMWGVGASERHRLEVALTPTGNGVMMAGRF
jgi:hypothetical protein